MRRQREKLKMLVALRRPGVDTTVVYDKGGCGKCLQDGPGCFDVRDIEVVRLKSIFFGWYDKHGPIDAIFIDK